jgi:hypothetical protein
MAKRTNRGAWGLVVGLAVAVLGGTGALSARYRRRADAKILPMGSWRFGTYPFYGVACGPKGSIPILDGYRRYFGFFSVRVR